MHISTLILSIRISNSIQLIAKEGPSVTGCMSTKIRRTPTVTNPKSMDIACWKFMRKSILEKSSKGMERIPAILNPGSIKG